MNRKLLKNNAKIALKRNFWIIMLVVLICGILGVDNSSIAQISISQYTNKINNVFQSNINTPSVYDVQQNIEPNLINLSSILIIFLAIIFILIAIAWIVFIVNPITVGYKRFFMKNRNGTGIVSDIFCVFSENYLPIVKAMFGTQIRIFAWSLLFIIPGIIKFYQYFFVPFILSENPNISGQRAREISTQMTKNYKFDIFILTLSFFGWAILTSILSVVATALTCCCCGIGGFVINAPLKGYIATTYAELYEERRCFAFANGITNQNELIGYPIIQQMI